MDWWWWLLKSLYGSTKYELKSDKQKGWIDDKWLLKSLYGSIKHEHLCALRQMD